MEITYTPQGDIAIVRSEQGEINDVQSALDLIATVSFGTGVRKIAIEKTAIAEEFFDLRTGLAGEILQKFTNYNVKVAIVGDFSKYTSKALRDFIFESNKGKSVFFKEDVAEALASLQK